ncbi:MAG: alpha/beta fold hydrolase BchO [Pseudomonadota bacterium]
MDWSEIESWPNAQLSRRVTGPVHRWHVQEAGAGPTMLLLHGAGGSTHNFRDLIAPLSQSFHIVALDLPGQGFTQLGARHRCGLDAMAEDILRLCAQERWRPSVIVGHSAGAAIALQMAMTQPSLQGQPPLVIGINAALGAFPGLAGVIFPIMAKALAAVPFTARLFSGASGNPARIKALISATGSDLDDCGIELYRRLVANRTHVDGTLLMMAQWKLQRLLHSLPTHQGPVCLIAAKNDLTVPPKVSVDTARKLPNGHVTTLENLGHLAHEEAPSQIADVILSFAQQHAGQGA